MLELSELFYSLQGESSWAGLPCVFIRLSGCNLRCRYCDARYTYEMQGEQQSVSDIMAGVDEYRCRLVEITGGEPLLQDDVLPLATRLLDAGYTVLLETNGSVSLAGVPGNVHVIMDIKCPDSGMADSLHPDNLAFIAARRQTGSRDEIKFVLTSPDDYLFAREMIRHHRLQECADLLLSPVVSCLNPTDLAHYLLEDRLPARLQLQLHTLLWPDAKRGK